MKVEDAEVALKLFRESIQGIRELKEAGEYTKECASYGVLAAFHALRNLDLFLTRSLGNRDAKTDVGTLSLFMSDMKPKILKLSCNDTHIQISLEDLISLVPTDNTPIDVRRRWQAIKNSEKTQPESLLDTKTMN